MPERISKSKLRKNSVKIGVEEREQSSSRLDVESKISDRGFENTTKNGEEKSLLRRKNDTEVSQMGMFKIVMDMSNELNNLLDNCCDSSIGNENIDSLFLLEIDVEKSFEKNFPLPKIANPRGCDNQQSKIKNSP